jgi:hypothetical protein
MGYKLIEIIEVGAGGAASIEFTGIPQDGVDLVLVMSLRSARSDLNDLGYLQINNITSNTYRYMALTGTGSGVSGAGYTSDNIYFGRVSASTSTANTFGSSEIYFSNYTSSSDKSISSDSVQEQNVTASQQQITAGKFPTTNPITSLKIYNGTASNFVQYSTASLYKITAD